MYNRSEDRHKSRRSFQSGAQKRKIAAEKEQKFEQILCKTPKISNYFIDSKIPEPANIDKPTTTSSSTISQFDETESKIDATNNRNPEVTSNEQPSTSSSSSNISKFDEVEIKLATTAHLEKISDNLNFTTDIGLWKEPFTDDIINFWIKKGSTELQNCDEETISKLSATQTTQNVNESKRKCTSSLFYRTNQNKEVVNRFWLCFSPSTGKIYCFLCKLLSTSTYVALGKEGYCDWKHASERVRQHELSKNHLNSVIVFSTRLNEVNCIDRKLQEQASEVAGYWREVLKRVVSTVTFIAERGLAFRGLDEIIGSPNNGNFLGIMELISQFDPFLAAHMKEYGNKGSGHTSYLSSTVVEDIIFLMGKEVLREIVARIKIAKYYSISVDSTADEGHIDQLTVVIRYVENLNPVERFLTFIPNCGHTGKDMAQALLEFLSKQSLNIMDCRSQSFDNAANMSGKYKGMQALIKVENPLAEHLPCFAHSLNLVGKSAANTCLAAVLFFSFVQELFVFFTNSTARHKILIEKLSSSKTKGNFYTLKKLSDTRWSCRADATKALAYGYKPIQDSLAQIYDDVEQKSIVRNEALGLLQKMSKLETTIYIKFWHDILERFNSTNKILQSSTMILSTAVNGLKSLKTFVESKRDSFETYEIAGKELSNTEEYESVRVRRPSVKLRPLDYGQAPAVQLSARDKFRTECFLPVIDQLNLALAERIMAYEAICERFGFLAELNDIEPCELEIKANNLVDAYPEDLERNLTNELVHLVAFSKQYEKREGESTEVFLYRLILENNFKSSFCNAEIALRIYLTLMVTNCSGERSFSKMKIIKNRLRTSMGQNRLENLTLLSLENDILRNLSFNQIIDDFAKEKSQIKNLSDPIYPELLYILRVPASRAPPRGDGGQQSLSAIRLSCWMTTPESLLSNPEPPILGFRVARFLRVSSMTALHPLPKDLAG
ncbi:uncharacterized protein LOC122511996 [Leptopilina heterotoma]|uniref:uncharacterized protein LOC122511996 n=1 Tax=Leptopilina heterotoma TaxID=63436 RepID=UPI001CA8C7B8|nr:uncharacterized protein LOC122511996 [Leptopilina heterotoma]